MFEPVTKRTKLVMRPDSIAEITRLAFKYAEGEGKPGATHIDLPVDVSLQEVPEDEAPLHRAGPNPESASLEHIEVAAGMIFRSQSPVILVGSDAVREDASEALTEMAETLHIPVVNTMMAKGMIPYTSPYSLWTVGIPQKDYANRVLEDADLLICVGYDIVEYAPQRINPTRKTPILHINTTPAHINKYYQTTCEVVGDISDSLHRITLRTHRTQEPTAALAIREQLVAEHESYAADASFPMKPQRVLIDVRKAMRPGDILLSDVGAHKMWIARHYNCYKPKTCLISNGFATMGFSLPGALAAKLVSPDKRVLVVTGDGGFMMNSQELETAVREHLPFVVLVFVDGGYGLIKWKGMDKFGETHYCDFTNPDLVAYAEAMHCKGYRITSADDLLPMLEDAFRQDVPALIECPIDYAENGRLTQHLKEVYAHLE